MAGFELMSLDNQFLLDYHHEELIKKINISSSLLVDILREKGTLTEQEDEYVRVRFVKFIQVYEFSFHLNC